MFSDLNLIVALWLIPAVLQILLPLAMLSCRTLMKLARKISSSQNNMETGAVHAKAEFSY